MAEQKQLADMEKRTEKAIKIAEDYGQIDGAHHKTWVIDQMCRVLLGSDYDEWVTRMKDGDDGLDTYYYDEGIAP